MEFMKRWNLKKHLILAPEGHIHKKIEFGNDAMHHATDHDLIAWHLNAHGLTQPEQLDHP